VTHLNAASVGKPAKPARLIDPLAPVEVPGLLLGLPTVSSWMQEGEDLAQGNLPEVEIEWPGCPRR
jgi:hypothetical protein